MEWAREHWVEKRAGTLLLLYIQPGASRTAVKGPFGEPPRLKISVQAPPVEGAANDAVLEFVADQLKVSRSKVHLLSGQTARNKNIWIENVTPDQVREAFLKPGR